MVVPPGYTACAFIPWGTPVLGDFPAFQPAGNSAAQQAQQIAMHHDGMNYFPLGKGSRGSRHGLLVVNHEYTDERHLHTGTTTMPPVSEWTLEMVRKSQNAHGVGVVEIACGGDGFWGVVRSPLNRRITANTPMSMSGPAAGHRLVRTAADPLIAIARMGATALGPAEKAFRRGDDEAAMLAFMRGVLGREHLRRLPEARRRQARENLDSLKAILVGAGLPPIGDDEVRGVSTRTLLVSGERSPAFARRLQDRLEELLPHTTRIEIPGASHLAHEDDAAAVNEAILAFLT